MTQPVALQKSVASTESKSREKYLLLEAFLGDAGLFWNRLPITPDLIRAWMRQLLPYTAKAIESGMKDYFKNEEFFPVPGTLIPYIKAKPNFLERSNEPG